MTEVRDGNGTVLLRNEFVNGSRVSTQTLADGQVVRYEYLFNGSPQYCRDHGYPTEWQAATLYVPGETQRGGYRRTTAPLKINGAECDRHEKCSGDSARTADNPRALAD